MAKKRIEKLTGLETLRVLLTAAEEGGTAPEKPLPLEELAKLLARHCPPGEESWMCENFRYCSDCWARWLREGE